MQIQPGSSEPSHSATNVTIYSDSGASNALKFDDLTSVNTVAACVPTTSGDVCQWNGSKFVRAAAGGAGGYVTIADEGTSRAARGTLNFIGAGVSCVDNSGASRTDCTIAGGSTFATTYSSTATDNRISLNSTGGALSIRDNATPISDYLFKIADSVGTNYLAMSPQGLELHNKGVTSGVIYKVLNVDTSSVVNTGLSAGSDPTEVLFRLSHTVQFAAGAVTTARAFVVEPPTYSSASASTLSDAATVAILAAPTAGTNMTITRSNALWVQAGMTTLAGGLTTAGDITFAGTNGPHVWDATNSRLKLGTISTTPTGTLHMSGGSGSAAQMRIDNTFSSVYMMCGSADSAAVAFCGSLSSHPFALRYANSNKVYLNSADLSPASDGGVDYGNQTQHIGSVIAYRLMNVVSTQSFSATPSFDFSTSGASKRMVLTGNVTSSTFAGCSSATDGMLVHLELVQDATGSRTWAGIPTGAKVAGGSMTLSTGANKVDMFTFECHSADSNTYVEVARSMNQ